MNAESMVVVATFTYLVRLFNYCCNAIVYLYQPPTQTLGHGGISGRLSRGTVAEGGRYIPVRARRRLEVRV